MKENVTVGKVPEKMDNRIKETFLPIFLHVGIWVFIFATPLLFSERVGIQYIVLRHWAPMFFALILFYLNYFQLIPRLFFDKRQLMFLIVNLGLIISFLLITDLILDFIKQGDLLNSNIENVANRRRGTSRNNFLAIYRQIPLLLLALGAALALKNTEKIGKLEKKEKEKENQHLRSEITALKYQVQPHFLFNTLNNIYSLIDINSKDAKNMILKLSKLMRYLLYKTQNEFVHLSDEIGFIESYIELMKLRYGDHVDIQTSFPGNTNQLKVPPLLLITLTENAFKHGIDQDKSSLIKFQLEIKNKSVTYRVINSYFPKNDSDRSGSGIGISNLTKRLEYCYEQKEYSLDQYKNGDLYTSELTIKAY